MNLRQFMEEIVERHQRRSKEFSKIESARQAKKAFKILTVLEKKLTLAKQALQFLDEGSEPLNVARHFREQCQSFLCDEEPNLSTDPVDNVEALLETRAFREMYPIFKACEEELVKDMTDRRKGRYADGNS